MRRGGTPGWIGKLEGLRASRQQVVSSNFRAECAILGVSTGWKKKLDRKLEWSKLNYIFYWIWEMRVTQGDSAGISQLQLIHGGVLQCHIDHVELENTV